MCAGGGGEGLSVSTLSSFLLFFGKSFVAVIMSSYVSYILVSSDVVCSYVDVRYVVFYFGRSVQCSSVVPGIRSYICQVSYSVRGVL